MGRSADTGEVAQEPDIARVVGKLVGSDEAAEGLAAKHRILVRVDLLEDGALVPHLAFIVFERVSQFILGDVHHPNLEFLVGLCVVHEIPEAAPRALHLTNLGAMKDLIHLLGEDLVDTGDQRLDRLDRIRRDRGRVGSGLRRECQIAHELLQLFTVVLLDLEVLLEKFAEFVEVDGFGLGNGCRFLLLCHRLLLDLVVVRHRLGRDLP